MITHINLGKFEANVALEVMTECTGIIKERLSLNLLVDKLVEKRIINDRERGEVLDEHCGLNADQRMDKLLGSLKTSIKDDGDDFHFFLTIIKEENTKKTDKLAQTLFETYKKKLSNSCNTHTPSSL